MKVVSTGNLKINLGDSQLNLFQLDKAETFVLTIQDKDSDTLILTGVNENGEDEFTPEGLPGAKKPINPILVSDIKLDELKNLYKILGNILKETFDNQQIN